MSEDIPRLRNIFSADEDPEDWQKAVETFPNRVPRFSTKDECLEFMRRFSYFCIFVAFPHR
jgi:hypothetical protein